MDLHPGIEIELIFDDKELDLATRQADVAIRMRRPKQLNLIQKNLSILIIIFMDEWVFRAKWLSKILKRLRQT